MTSRMAPSRIFLGNVPWQLNGPPRPVISLIAAEQKFLHGSSMAVQVEFHSLLSSDKLHVQCSAGFQVLRPFLCHLHQVEGQLFATHKSLTLWMRQARWHVSARYQPFMCGKLCSGLRECIPFDKLEAEESARPIICAGLSV
jgi:hypothetical protein